MNFFIITLVLFAITSTQEAWAGGGYPSPKITLVNIGANLIVNIRMATLLQNGNRLLVEGDLINERNVLLDYNISKKKVISKKPLGSDSFFLTNATSFTSDLIEGLAFGPLATEL
jgi:hypothetical protein